MLLYCFISARTGEVHKSIARRGSARLPSGDEKDIGLEAYIMAHFELTIKIVDKEPMLVLTYDRRFIKGY
ncbi:Zinc finger C2H2 [Penicillium cinerascens]|uniref:Zinc finger C2H2 n=1 Tax=Penicillium cinerascens TaxID=70096 RepID=A0A9W9NB74_9EURO|nr:Zinc finger C2H2 [Penicillium cinerascens]KAJ5215828.1 Zinc finger C2H2 [Penicillium cinerascens]